ncbi:MAG: drug/metabolite transporter (DMT)-like permease [Gammaproteobacteria bacterium]|jgi:drug/metabolite transporter (DMT)-like permease
MNDQSPQLKAYVLLTLTTMCWGMNAIFSKLAVGHIAPMQLVTFRWLGVVLLLSLFARKKIIKDWPVIRRHLPFLALMGSVGFTTFNALFYVAAHTTSAINIGILQGAIPVFVLLGSFILFKHRVHPIQLCGVFITIVGVIIVASGGSLQKLQTLSFSKGDIYMLIACFFYAAYSIFLTKRPKASALSIFSVMATAAWLASLPLVAVETYQQGWQAPSQTGWIIVLLVALLPSLVAQIFFIQGVGLIGPGRAGVFVNLVPVFASLLAVSFLGESFQLYHGLALSLVLGGIGLSELGKKQPLNPR